MVSNIYNFKNGEEAFDYLKELLASKFSEFIVTKKTDVDLKKSKFGFFAIWFTYKGVEFKIGCERGVLYYEFKIDNVGIGLHHFDKGMNDVLGFSRENVEYTLSVFRRIVDEQRHIAPPSD